MRRVAPQQFVFLGLCNAHQVNLKPRGYASCFDLIPYLSPVYGIRHPISSSSQAIVADIL
jgi:hypothetical protein